MAIVKCISHKSIMVIVMTISFKSLCLAVVFFFLFNYKAYDLFPRLKTRSKDAGRKYVICERKNIVMLLIVVLMVHFVAVAQLFQNWSKDPGESMSTSL